MNILYCFLEMMGLAYVRRVDTRDRYRDGVRYVEVVSRPYWRIERL